MASINLENMATRTHPRIGTPHVKGDQSKEQRNTFVMFRPKSIGKRSASLGIEVDLILTSHFRYESTHT